MGYRLTDYGKTRKNLPGVHWRDLSNEEYAAACNEHPGMESQGYFEKVEEPAKGAPRSRREGNVEVYEVKVTTAPPAEEAHDV